MTGKEKGGSDLSRRVVSATIALAEEVGWRNVRLHDVAQRVGIGVAEINRHFRDLDAVADAWFATAQQAILAPVGPGFYDLAPRERVNLLMLRWFDALAPHRRVAVEMLTTKMWPFHPHHWVPMVFNLSRLILWLREAAALGTESPRREAEEVGLTWLFLATLAVWSRDETDGQSRTRRFLARRLGEADHMVALVFGRRRSETPGLS